MTEYKAGDRVLIKDDAVEDGWLKPGEEGTISEFDECASYCEGHLIFRNEDGDVSNYDLDEVTLRPAPFKVGDKVKILKDSNSSRLKPGEVVTLKDKPYGAGLWTIEENNSDGWSPNVREMDFEAYTEPEEREFKIGDEVVRTGPHTLCGDDDFEYDRESDLGDRGVLVENTRQWDGKPSTYYNGNVRIKWTQGKTAGRTSQINPASLTLASEVEDETVSDFKVGQVYEWTEGGRRFSQVGTRFRLTDVDTLAQEVTYEYLTGSLVGATSIFKVPFDVLAENRLVTDHVEETEPKVGEIRRWKSGDEFRVVEVDDDSVTYLYLDTDDWGEETFSAPKKPSIEQSILVSAAAEAAPEAVEEPEEDADPFPVGAKVRVTGDVWGTGHRLPVGTIGEVVLDGEERGKRYRLIAHTEKREWGMDPEYDARRVDVRDLEVVKETTDIVDVWDTGDLKVGDVVVRKEYADITPAQVERKVVKAPEPAPEPEPHRNDLPTEEGSSVKFTGWRHATLTYTRDEPQTLQWVFVSGVPVKEIFDPFTTENEFEVKYDAGK